jgi:hypothetical protein
MLSLFQAGIGSACNSQQGVGDMADVRFWMRARCSSFAKNWRSSVLSFSLSFSMSDCSMLKSEEDILGGGWTVGNGYRWSVRQVNKWLWC